jgi:hypothetical protein
MGLFDMQSWYFRSLTPHYERYRVSKAFAIAENTIALQSITSHVPYSQEILESGRESEWTVAAGIRIRFVAVSNPQSGPDPCHPLGKRMQYITSYIERIYCFHVRSSIHLAIHFHYPLQCPNPSISKTTTFRELCCPSNSCPPSASFSCIPSSIHQQRDNQAIQP